jgi:hypothetical protein
MDKRQNMAKQGSKRQLDNRQPRQSENDEQREQLGPRGVRGKAARRKWCRKEEKRRLGMSIPGTLPET